MDTPIIGIPKPARPPSHPVDPFMLAASWDLYSAGQHIIDALDHSDRKDFEDATQEMRAALVKARRRL